MYLKVPNWVQTIVLRLYAGQYNHHPGTFSQAYGYHRLGPFFIAISHITMSNEPNVHHWVTFCIGRHEYGVAHFVEAK